VVIGLFHNFCCLFIHDITTICSEIQAFYQLFLGFGRNSLIINKKLFRGFTYVLGKVHCIYKGNRQT